MSDDAPITTREGLRIDPRAAWPFPEPKERQPVTASEITQEVGRRLDEHVQLIAMVLRMQVGLRTLATLNGDLGAEARATCEALANESDALLQKVRQP